MNHSSILVLTEYKLLHQCSWSEGKGKRKKKKRDRGEKQMGGEREKKKRLDCKNHNERFISSKIQQLTTYLLQDQEAHNSLFQELKEKATRISSWSENRRMSV